MLVKVLVADDNSANTDIFRKRFEQMGLQVIIITDGHKVIDAVTEELPDLVHLRPEASTVLLVGGDKTNNWAKWYQTAIPEAEALYEDYLQELQTLGVLADTEEDN